MPYQARFQAKVVTEMIALPLMKAMTFWMAVGLMCVFQGTISDITPYPQILVLTLIVLLLIVPKRLSKVMHLKSP